MAEKTESKRQKPRGPNRATLLKQVEEHEGVLAEKDSELEKIQQQMQMLAQTPPVLFTISVNRMTGVITSVPALSEESSVQDLRLLLKALNIYQSNVVDLMAEMVLKSEEKDTEEDESEVEENEEDSEEGEEEYSEESEAVEESEE